MSKQHVAQALITSGAIGFKPHAPITFKSGMLSPVYVDSRVLPFHPAAWRVVIAALQQSAETLTFDVIAGVETAGIPHGAALAYALQRPFAFIRKQAKQHGTKNRVEGGDVSGKRVLLIEDMVTTGGSSLNAVEGLREAGAIVTDILAIITYDFPEMVVACQAAHIRLHTITTFADVLALGVLQGADRAIVEDWLADPNGWAQRRGLA